ncbi:MAG: octanoyltransferase LipM [Herpetosiphonaceae bacterium]|nr:MAG: octanoyltransferase LipM [Herpetosiphonaceae bacterium]
MAIDQAIAQIHVQGTTPPTLRFYRWSPPCLSIGAYQHLREEVNLEGCKALGVDLVRRPTGGRAILHDQELTYSIVARAYHPLVSGVILESYRKISAALVMGLHLLGVAAELAPEPSREVHKSAACFDVPSAHEVTAGGRKILGSAQVRKEGVLLQHGSLLLHADAARLHRCLILPPSLTPDVLAGRIAGLDEILGRSIDFAEVTEALVEGFLRSWGIELLPGDLTAEERALAERLRAEKYANEQWTTFR